MKNFKRKTAAITGAGSGIGRALAQNLARQGCNLALSDIDPHGLADTVRGLQDSGVQISARMLDVADRDAMHEWAAQVAEEHGNAHLIFNNAGVALGSPIDGMRDEDLRWIMDINFWGVVNGTQAFLPQLKAAGEGHIINISSVFGLAAVPTQGAYNASKFAVRGYTEALRQELDMARSKVSATSVHPGGIRTAIAKSARFSDAMKTLGGDESSAKNKFEKLFMTSPERAAKVILEGVRQNRRRVLIGPDARVIDVAVRLMPELYQSAVVRFTRRVLA